MLGAFFLLLVFLGQKMPIVWNSLVFSIQTGPQFLALAEFKSSAKPSIFLHSKPFPKRIPFQNPRLPPNRQTAAAIPNPSPSPASTTGMAASEAPSDPHRREPGQRRPMCAVCTKPLRACLCGRLRGPPLDTAVGVTVLQHTMEVNHPLSSIRVARLGLRNLAVTQVTDVNYRASFRIRTLDAASNLGGGETEAVSRQGGAEGLENGKLSNGVSSDSDRQVGRDSNGDFERPVLAVNQLESSAVDGPNTSETGMPNKVNGDIPHPSVENCSVTSLCTENTEVASAAIGEGWTVENMDKCSVAYTEKELRIDIERGVKPKLRWLSRAPLGIEAAENGFTVTKIQKKKSKLTGEVTELEDFSITIPPHSALLFPCQRAVSIDALDCQVKHLIVLDGTWAKAQRMYHENPWLQLLPHVMLDTDRVSLYSEVRHEPKAGCLSTIESIVVTMKKLGEDEEGLDDVLGVFESMIVDQRRFKEENWKPKLK
ncbi:uncharacterized protein LOC124698698 [Lolium rigidum]|uniref:uncharacterized protein LOC124698698 n=1 Tax=Lolium rigidum TaxID=89674 RepID=UPI001F5D5998|nr:uncharacterized protein LOC124698698 [Lolium rigidum]